MMFLSRPSVMSGLEPILEKILALAVAEARLAGASAIEPVHLFIAVFKLVEGRAFEALLSEGVDPVVLRRRARGVAVEAARRGYAPSGPDRVSGRVRAILDVARTRAARVNRGIDPEDVLCALLSRPDAVLVELLEWEGVPVRRIIDRLEGSVSPDRPPAIASPPAVGLPAPEISAQPPRRGHPETPAIDQFGKDLSALARGGRLGPVIGRHAELKQLIRVLLRREANNPVLIGDAGVGKTAIVEALAQRAAAADAPAEIRDLRIVELVLSALLAGAGVQGEIERRIHAVLDEAARDPDLVLFIDEIHAVVGAGGIRGGASDLAQVLKPVLARGALRLIGATTSSEYCHHIEKDAALERRFSPVAVEEPTAAEARAILHGIRPGLEAHHHIAIADEALEAAVEMSVRYLPDRRLPDKARALLDQAAAIARFRSLTPGVPAAPAGPVGVGRHEVALAVSEWTRIPVDRVGADERKRLLEAEEVLRRRVIGQDHAIAVVARVIRTAFADLSRRGRPHGVFLFLGPTGVGKTELAKALAEFLFGDEKHLVRIDMSEYHDRWCIQKLIGAPPGYIGHEEGGQLTSAIRRRPYSVVLLDEIDKAHPEVVDVFLPAFDDGRLTDSHGRVADFSNTVVIMTSNLGFFTEKARPGIGFGRSAHCVAADDLGTTLRSSFRPEILNRVSEIVRFHSLGPEQVRGIIDKLIRGVRERIREKRIGLELDPAAYDVLVGAGYRHEYGAREMERVIERWIVQPLADLLVAGDLHPGGVVRVVPWGDSMRFEVLAHP